jgi:hypothetical protein
MNINDLYPSKYIKADDIQGQQVPVTIQSVVIEEIADKEHKPVMRFIGKEKGMVLNKTNALTCAHVWGDESNAWAGQRATLLAAPVMFQGKQVMGLQLLPTLAQPQQVSINSPDYAQQAAPGAPQQAQQPNPAHHKPGPHDAGLAPAAQVMETLAQDIQQHENQLTDEEAAAIDIPF